MKHQQWMCLNKIYSYALYEDRYTQKYVVGAGGDELWGGGEPCKSNSVLRRRGLKKKKGKKKKKKKRLGEPSERD